MREAVSNRVTIEDVDAATFKQLLRYVYCGQLPDDMDELPEKFLPSAEKYDMKEMKVACVASMIKNIKVENVVDYVVMAHLFQYSDLKMECLQHLQKWKDSVSEDAFELLKSHPDLLLELYKNSSKS